MRDELILQIVEQRGLRCEEHPVDASRESRAGTRSSACRRRGQAGTPGPGSGSRMAAGTGGGVTVCASAPDAIAIVASAPIVMRPCFIFMFVSISFRVTWM